MNRYRCVVNVGRDPGVVCGHAVHDLKRCTLKWGLCKYQRPEVTRAAGSLEATLDNVQRNSRGDRRAVGQVIDYNRKKVL